MNKIITSNRWFVWCVVLSFFITVIVWWQAQLFLLEQEQFSSKASDPVVISQLVKNVAEAPSTEIDEGSLVEGENKMSMNTFNSSKERVWTINKNSDDKFSVKLDLEERVEPASFSVSVINPSTYERDNTILFRSNEICSLKKFLSDSVAVSPEEFSIGDQKKPDEYYVCDGIVGEEGYIRKHYLVSSPDGKYMLSIETGWYYDEGPAPIEDVLDTIVFTSATEGGYDFEFKYPSSYFLNKDSLKGDGAG